MGNSFMKQMPLQCLFVLNLWIRNILPVVEKVELPYCFTPNNPDPHMKKKVINAITFLVQISVFRK